LYYYATSCGNLLATFRDNPSVLSSGVKNPKERLLLDSRPLQKGRTGCPETLVRNYSLRTNPDECSSQLLHGGSQKLTKNQVQYICGVSPGFLSRLTTANTEDALHSESYSVIIPINYFLETRLNQTLSE
jgi:hypothetical protein